VDWITETERKIPVVADVDVLVCGGGVAGVAAAVCAARNGASAMLVERYGFLGGMATAGLVITTPPLTNGINVEISNKLVERDVYRRCLHPGEDPAQSDLTAFDPEILKYCLQAMLLDERVRLLLHTYIAQTIVEDSTVKGVVIENKAGRQAILARMVIDATGDGDVAAFANAPYEMAETPLPLTLMFNMVDVDIKKALGQIRHWGNFRREHVMRLVGFLRKGVRGFEASRIEYTATQVGIRETRRILGAISPSLNEVKNNKFHDTVAKPYADTEMRVPYRSLVPQRLENLLVAGRCISAQQDAMVPLRLIPVCLVTGQAAGTAAALAVKDNVAPRQLDVPLLQRTLINQGMNLGL